MLLLFFSILCFVILVCISFIVFFCVILTFFRSLWQDSFNVSLFRFFMSENSIFSKVWKFCFILFYAISVNNSPFSLFCICWHLVILLLTSFIIFSFGVLKIYFFNN
jgi:hypothetical protein